MVFRAGTAIVECTKYGDTTSLDLYVALAPYPKTSRVTLHFEPQEWEEFKAEVEKVMNAPK